ncbi:tandem-95 repeat protein [Halomonas sp. MCCC 1A17488]|uniref:Ig-like domain-containing protein n=1 Tax=unclassified Halomonas TaxID=2609666 RepID=UPI0018D23574|nr:MULTISPECIES: Ig-like domain-containing protein [unclassified Halomonas]MCE8018114.1 tandem-95 repeat protein [Halomonas sp. MCCC 1A17488]MCG3241447.1 tandem-95 repeat protein [Halomonas sp. MCCC 1A17488]QPP48594.1 tandem-95 repeat protein [Halomonas sp. SS10-MC5]
MSSTVQPEEQEQDGLVTLDNVEEAESASTTVQFQQGLDGYAGSVDTYLHGGSKATSRAGAATLNVDSDDKGNEVQTLLRFEQIFGSGAGQIPQGATILSATLELHTTSKGDGARLHRMLIPWNDTDTWNSFSDGLQADGVEARASADLTTGFVPTGTTRLDVSASLQAWADGAPNHGWAFLSTGPDGWDFHSAEGSTPPRLVVEYTTDGSEPDNRPPVANDDSATTTEGEAVEIAVLANDSDPDGDPLTVDSFTQPANGSVTLTDDDMLAYTPDDGFTGEDSLTYRASDGELASDSATLSVTVEENEPPPASATLQFQQGVDGYAGVVDTYLHGGSKATSRAGATLLNVDSDDKGNPVQTLLRFEQIFGSGAGQIPLGATIVSATLELNTSGKGDGARLHRMLVPWNDTDTWNSFSDGLQADGVEAHANADLTTGFVPTGTTRLDVTASLQAWADGAPNHGWAFLPTGPDGWDFHSAEGSTPPRLVVEYTTDGSEPDNHPPVAYDDSATTSEDAAVEIAVLANDSDPNGDPLTVGSFTQPSNGSVTLNPDGTLLYTPTAGFVGDDVFTYRASDGELASDPATVTVTVEPAEPPPVTGTLQFQQGLDGYAGVVDTYLHGGSKATSRAGVTTLNVDSEDKGNAVQTLLRFEQIFGSGSGQIPLGATIVTATLELNTTGKGDGARLHRMLMPWNDTDTWNTFTDGLQADGVEAHASADLVTGYVPVGTTRLDVTASLQAWADGTPNYGWAFLPVGPDGWDFHSAEGSTPPRLVVEYTTDGSEPDNHPPVANDDNATTSENAAVEIAVLANDSDPDGDPLTVGSFTQPTHGTVTLNPSGTLTYSPNQGFIGSDSFTYRASDGSLQSGSATVIVSVESGMPPPIPLETSYIATEFGTDHRRNFEHTNANKSFFHAGTWWAVLPEQSGWHVYRFDGTLPEPGTMGGWSVASPTMMTSGRRADIAWHDATDTLYVLNFGPTESTPHLYAMAYDAQAQSFVVSADIKLAGSGGKLSGVEWQRNPDMALGMDQNGNPLVAIIGPSEAGGEQGLKLAYPTSSDLSAWSVVDIDNGPTTVSASNGDNKVDFVSFQLNGVDHVGLVYGDSTANAWKFASQPTSATPSDYADGWTIEQITDRVALDDHLAAVWTGSAIVMTMKDDRDAIWLVKGLPGAWEEPVLVHAASHKASRPTLAYDEDNDFIYIFYQENAVSPYGDIHFKVSQVAELSFDTAASGTRILTSGSNDENMTDPQTPVHAVGEATGDKFFLFARNAEAKEIWYNDFQLDDDIFLA